MGKFEGGFERDSIFPPIEGVACTGAGASFGRLVPSVGCSWPSSRSTDSVGGGALGVFSSGFSASSNVLEAPALSVLELGTLALSCVVSFPLFTDPGITGTASGLFGPTTCRDVEGECEAAGTAGGTIRKTVEEEGEVGDNGDGDDRPYLP